MRKRFIIIFILTGVILITLFLGYFVLRGPQICNPSATIGQFCNIDTEEIKSFSYSHCSDKYLKSLSKEGWMRCIYSENYEEMLIRCEKASELEKTSSFELITPEPNCTELMEKLSKDYFCDSCQPIT